MTAGALDLRHRDRLFEALAGPTFDVVVIGAGITGAGIARDAALRGLSVALVDAGDFAAGTSSRSSKLVHGGIRYLSQGDIALVREAARDRQVIAQLAPHLAERTLFVVPARTRWELTKFRLGLVAYERIGAIARGDRHEYWGIDRIATEEPAMRRDGFVGALAYPEYITDDGRLTLANVRGAAAAGAVVANYAEAVAVHVEHGHARAITIADRTAGDRTCRIDARVVVNAAGPWVDRVRRLENADAASQLMLTRGIHVAVPRTRLPIRHTVNLKGADNRGMFAIPRGGMAYIGTTDTFYPEPAYWPSVDAADVDYVLDAANRAFDIPPLEHRDVVSLWAGLRPLMAEPGKRPSEISRRDEITIGPSGMITISGGKLTAFRRMASRVVDACQRALGTSVTPSRSADLPLPGGDLSEPVDALVQRLSARVGAADARRLVRLYGTEATDVAAAGGDIAAEVTQAVQREGAVRLEDYWVRRSARAWFDPDGGLGALEPAADAMAPLLGWSVSERSAQIEACRRHREMEMAAIMDSTRVGSTTQPSGISGG